MTDNSTPTRTELATAAAAEGSQVQKISFQQLERMASAVAKSGMFAVKTPEAALTLMLVAQAEGIHPAQAMMDYDLIEGKPALKSSAMLARFLRAGGKVQWLEQSNDKVTGKFTSPGGASIVSTWDNERVKLAGLGARPNHQKFPLQMKRARCISEGVRAVWPVTTLYTPEEFQDGATPIDVTPVPQAEAVRAAVAANPLTEAELDEHFGEMDAAKDAPTLPAAFASAWKHAKESGDARAGAAFKQAYEGRKAELAPIGEPQP
jgi:hypothetical protein